ncbi:MAG: LD-carboxypeptidase [Lentisphaeria bacterium]|nr:LD-carboxypeptidase [Lentisphaeria bacterium]
MFDSWIKNKKISVIAPAGRVDAELLAQSEKIWRSWGAEVRIMPHVIGFEKDFFSAPAELRAEDLNNAFADSGTDFIICARGGYGCAELYDLIDWNILRQNQKVLIGYSDVTSLHIMMLKHQCGIPVTGAMFLKAPELFAVHSDNAATFANAVDGSEAVFETSEKESFYGYCVVANLAVLASICGSELLCDFKDKCLIIEDLNEPPYKIHRMLLQLELSGIFKQISALAVGEFLDCGENPSELHEIILSFAQKYDLPCFLNLPIGHGNLIHAVNMTHKIRINQ